MTNLLIFWEMLSLQSLENIAQTKILTMWSIRFYSNPCFPCSNAHFNSGAQEEGVFEQENESKECKSGPLDWSLRV